MNLFSSRLKRFSAIRRQLVNAALGYRLGTVALGIGVAGLVLLSGWLPGAVLNLGLFAVGALAVLVLFGKFLWRRERFRSYLDEAFHLEQLVGTLNSRVVSAWSFLRDNVSQPLALVVIEQARTDLQSPVEERLDRCERNRRRRQFAGMLVTFIALGLTPWFGFSRVADNLQRSWFAALDWLFPVHFLVEPAGPRHIKRIGESFELTLRFQERKFDEVSLTVRETSQNTNAAPQENAANATVNATMNSAANSQPEPTEKTISLAVAADGTARHTLTSAVETSLQVAFAFGSRRTEPMEVIFTTAPSLVNMQTEIVSPTYTGQLPKSLEGIQQRLLGLPGTRMTLGFTFSKDLEAATITWDDGQRLPLETLGRFASVSFMHQAARQARLQVRDIHGLEMDAPLTIDFDLQIDERPQVFVPKHLKEDMPQLAAEVSSFGFGVRAADDYGVTRCLLKWRKSTVDSPATILDQGEIERLVSPSQRNVVINFEKIFDGLPLKTGDKLSFEIEVADNRAPDKQTSRSRQFSLFVYEQDLGKLSIAQLGFGGAKELVEGRIGKSQKATAVKSPEGLRNRELVKNEFDADVRTSTQAPTVRGEFGRATQDYFRVLSGAKYEANVEKKSTPQIEPPPPEKTE